MCNIYQDNTEQTEINKMSTTFAVKLTDEKYIEVAHRFGVGNGKVGIKWLDIKLSDALEIFKGVTSLQDIKVIPTDNTAQGVKTIRDLIKLDKYGVLSDNKFYIDKIKGLNELVEDQAEEIETLKDKCEEMHKALEKRVETCKDYHELVEDQAKEIETLKNGDK
tara:strand:+ start:1398 stop:1889 length:492 start_codon:yes stop_codon:yes gene_type:complete